ncbi:putative ribosomal N-acetyltransferase YdaF [Daldinia childiae]|uniref:putative ribosomal N-acetyltransferase YdaF n=1 Tax=Daldinia childiae TaxID=326645 RepID=UPI00144680FE|nr:putative ribosomal N-acetyltransferase YdaF [Daldinia childiae]KAF3059632.1 putative ribosomal N-acetyltransferase YdaF [Daldinia childiae]
MADSTSQSTPAPIVTTDKCIIRAYAPSDAEGAVAAANYPELVQYMRNTFPHPYTLDSANYWINLCLNSDPMVNFGIFTPEGIFAGGIGLTPYKDIEYRTWEIGYWVGKDFWGKGIATSALKAFSVWAFERFPELIRIEAVVFIENIASQKVLERVGYTKEGIRRQAVCKKEKIMDQVMYSLLRDDLRDLS